MDTWTHAHGHVNMDMQTHRHRGHVDTWTHGHVDTGIRTWAQTQGHRDIWKKGHRAKRQRDTATHGHVDTWIPQYGGTNTLIWVGGCTGRWTHMGRWTDGHGWVQGLGDAQRQDRNGRDIQGQTDTNVWGWTDRWTDRDRQHRDASARTDRYTGCRGTDEDTWMHQNRWTQGFTGTDGHRGTVSE